MQPGVGGTVPQAIALGLTVNSPRDRDQVSSTAVIVAGTVRQDATVAVNGLSVVPNSSGEWSTEVELSPDVNLLEIFAFGLDGQEEFQSLVVFSVSAAAGSLTVGSPADGAVVSSATIEVAGSASPDSVVSVDGILAEVDSNGVWRASIALVVGANLIEVTSTRLDGSSQFKSIGIFRE